MAKAKSKSKKPAAAKTKAKPSKVKAVPAGYETVTPYITVRGAAKAIDFYKKAFGARETLRLPSPDGQIGHAEISIGKSHIMLSDEFPDMGARSPQMIGGSPVLLHLYVENVDAAFKRAEQAGAKVVRPLADMFYGDRGGQLEDPFGNKWWLASRIEEVPEKELMRRMAAMEKQPKK
jgi:PhnB protein